MRSLGYTLYKLLKTTKHLRERLKRRLGIKRRIRIGYNKGYIIINGEEYHPIYLIEKLFSFSKIYDVIERKNKILIIGEGVRSLGYKLLSITDIDLDKTPDYVIMYLDKKRIKGYGYISRIEE